MSLLITLGMEAHQREIILECLLLAHVFELGTQADLLLLQFGEGLL